MHAPLDHEPERMNPLHRCLRPNHVVHVPAIEVLEAVLEKIQKTTTHTHTDGITSYHTDIVRMVMYI